MVIDVNRIKNCELKPLVHKINSFNASTHRSNILRSTFQIKTIIHT